MKLRLIAPDRPATRTEVLIGRGLAVSAHPALAWPRLSLAQRMFLTFTYFAASFLAVLGALMGFAG